MARSLKLASALVMFAFLANSGPAHGHPRFAHGVLCPIWPSATINYIEECIDALDHINSQGDDGWGTLLHAAVQSGSPVVVRFLIDSGASVRIWSEKFNDLAIHRAAMKGRPDIIRILLDAGSPPDLPGGSNNRTPLHNAALAENPKAVEAMMVLLDAGADPDMEDDNGRTALDYTGRNSYLPYAEGYRSLVERLQ